MRTQRGITLIEIMLVAVIVAAGAVGAFILAKNTRVSAAVEREQKDIATLARTVESAFSFQPNFSALGNDGATYLRDQVSGAGLRFGVDGTRATLLTNLGGGSASVELATATVEAPNGSAGIPHNGYTLTYRGVLPAECVRLVSATAARTARIDLLPDAGQPGVLAAGNGRVIADKGRIAQACASAPVVRLSFAPARAISAGATATPPPLARCAPVRERQYAACPAGQSGSITQERVGTCTGTNQSLIYTAWTTTETHCVEGGDAPPEASPDALPPACGLSTFTRAQACPAGEVGQIVQRRTIDTCRGITPPWEDVSNSCQVIAGGCTPEFERTTRQIACPGGLGGSQDQEQTRSSQCIAGVAQWGPIATTILGNTCAASCMEGDTCCKPQRRSRPAAQCPAGTYGVAEEEQFLGCINATTQASSWSEYQVMLGSTSCNACPSETETETVWQAREQACPGGMGGMIRSEVQRTRTRTRDHHCPAGTTVLPAPTVSAWSEWTDTGNERNVVNTCVATNACAPLPPVAESYPIATQPYSYWLNYLASFRVWSSGDVQPSPPAACTAENVGQLAVVNANISAPASFCTNLNRQGVNASYHICSPSGWVMISYRPISRCDNTMISPRPELAGEFMGEQFTEYMGLISALEPRPVGAFPEDPRRNYILNIWHRDAATRPNAVVAYSCGRYNYW